jgi:peptidylprolyl isomerase
VPALALLLPALAACGSEDDSSSASDSSSEAPAASGSVEGLSVDGEVGESLTVEFDDALDKPSETEITTLVEGDGDEIEDGDVVTTYLYVANGTSQEKVYDDYDNGAPQSLPNDDQAPQIFLDMMDGATYGSRVVAVTTADELFEGDSTDNPLGLGDDDSVVVVADLVEEQVVSPEPTSNEAEDADPADQPTVVEEDGKPVGLDFEGVEEPELDAPVQRVVLEEGDGAPVSSTDTITVDYLGATYDADAPFDESYSRGEPLVSPLSGLIPGWAIGLDGVKVGSRVLLQIPPGFGYGAQGSPPAIPGNATLWFLIDVIKAERG